MHLFESLKDRNLLSFVSGDALENSKLGSNNLNDPICRNRAVSGWYRRVTHTRLLVIHIMRRSLYTASRLKHMGQLTWGNRFSHFMFLFLPSDLSSFLPHHDTTHPRVGSPVLCRSPNSCNGNRPKICMGGTGELWSRNAFNVLYFFFLVFFLIKETKSGRLSRGGGILFFPFFQTHENNFGYAKPRAEDQLNAWNQQGGSRGRRHRRGSAAGRSPGRGC